MMKHAPESPRFGFGDNWMNFLAKIDETRIAEAEKSLRSLLAVDRLDEKSFLDIGCGSGLFSLAAARLGARVHSFDFDKASVSATQVLRDRHFPRDRSWVVEQGSVLDTDYMRKLGQFDIVYSWGVLHHTGAMMDAIDAAAGRVAPGGLFAFALYRKTMLCPLWTVEKRWYATASPRLQAAARAVYVGLLRAAFLLRGRDFQAHTANYHSVRGMNFLNDVHDWMGGFPYESIAPATVSRYMNAHGFSELRSFTKPYEIGIFGSGCDEYVYRRSF